jgi:hypothetical protein
MLTKYQNQLVLGIFVVWMLGFAFVMGRSTQHQEDRKQIEAAHKTGQAIQNQKRADEGDSRPDGPPNHQADNRSDQAPEITFIGLKLGEGLLIFVTVWLVLVTKALVDGSKNTAERQLRAYVSVMGGHVKVVAGSSDKLYLRGNLEFKNAGQTPAYDFSSWTITELVDDPEIMPEMRSNGAGSSVVGPNTDRFVDIAKGPLTQADIDAIRRGTKHIIVWGEVTYTDAFGHTYAYTHHSANGRLRPDSVSWPLAPIKISENKNS